MEDVLRVLLYGVIVVLPIVLVYRARRSIARAKTEPEKDWAHQQMSNATAIFATVTLGAFVLAAILIAIFS